jgi:FkbM family methyltransferase
MKGLGGDPIFVRPGTSDLDNAADYLDLGIHFPPPEIASQDLRRIAELGSNMGAALTGLAVAYPRAELLGVEPDPGNLAVAGANLARFGDRARLIRAGIWDEDCALVIQPDERNEHGLVVRPATDREADDEGLVPARTIDSVLAERWPDDGPIDYLHVSIEGSERRAFAAQGSWPSRVRSLRVELHPYFGYEAQECIGQLEAHGYRAWRAPSPPDKWIFAVRDRDV